MGVQRRDSVSMIEHHRLAVFLLAPRDHHRPRRDRPDLLALEAVDVDPLVVVMAAAQSEAARDPAVNRPRDAHEAWRRRPVTIGEGRDRGRPGFLRIAEIPSPASLSSVAGRPPGLSKRTAGWTWPTLEGCSHSVMGGDSVEVTARAETLPPHPAIATAQAATNRREPDSGRRACVIPRSPLTN